MNALTPKERTSYRRQAVLWGFVGGVLLYLVTHYLRSSMEGTGKNQSFTPKYAIFFGDISGWPAYMKSFWPLDLLEVCLALGVIIYLFNVSAGRPAMWDPRRPKVWLGAFVGYGSLGALATTALSGWFAGLEGFILVGGGLTLFGAVILGIFVLMIGGGAFLADKLGPKLSKVQETPLGGQLKRAGHYLNADDVPDSTPPTT